MILHGRSWRQSSHTREIVFDLPIGFTPSGPLAFWLAFLMDELIGRTAIRKEYRRGHWVAFGRDDWIKVAGCRRYGKVKAAARDSGFIEVNDHYRAAVADPKLFLDSSKRPFTKSVRLTKGLRNGRTYPYVLPSCLTPQRFRLGSSIEIGSDDAVGLWLASKFAEFELPSALPRTLDPWSELLVRRILRGRIYAKRCGFGKRLHTSFSAIRRDVRAGLTIGGDPCAELDIANCQPLLLAALVGGSIDASDFRGICEHGELYVELLAELRQRGATWADLMPQERRGHWFKDRAIELGDVKKALLVLLFDDNRAACAGEMWRIVKDRWPSVAAYVVGSKRHDHKELSRRLQRRESSLMIDGVCGRLMAERSTVPILTVHDAIVCKVSDAERIADTIRSVFKDHGLSPWIKTTSANGGRNGALHTASTKP